MGGCVSGVGGCGWVCRRMWVDVGGCMHGERNFLTCEDTGIMCKQRQ